MKSFIRNLATPIQFLFFGVFFTAISFFIVRSREIAWPNSPYKYEEIRWFRGFPCPYLSGTNIGMTIHPHTILFAFDVLVWAGVFLTLKRWNKLSLAWKIVCVLLLAIGFSSGLGSISFMVEAPNKIVG